MLMRLRTSLLLAVLLTSAALAAGRTRWVVTWGTAPAPQLSEQKDMLAARLVFDNQTLREIVHISLGGETLRVRLSNAYAKTPLEIGAVHIALRAKGSSLVAGSDRAVTFSGRQALSIPPDAPVISDPVKLTVPPSADLAISIFLPKPTLGAGIHYAAQQTSYVGPGDLTAAPSFAEATTFTAWAFLAGVDVLAPESASAVVAFGDSITDGSRSTLDAESRWPDILAARLLARRGAPVAVMNAGIGGNRILHDPTKIRFGVNALARFDRDVLAQPGVGYVIVLEGINDLGHPGSGAPESETVTADDIVAGLKQMIERAHEKGLKIFGATLTPFEGTESPGYFTPAKETQRKAVNQWIRTGRAFDGVIDFDKAVEDPGRPGWILPAYDGGDHLHPGDAGYRAMGQSVDLALFR